MSTHGDMELFYQYQGNALGQESYFFRKHIYKWQNSLVEDAIEARNNETLRKCYTRLSIMVDYNGGIRNFVLQRILDFLLTRGTHQEKDQWCWGVATYCYCQVSVNREKEWRTIFAWGLEDFCRYVSWKTVLRILITQTQCVWVLSVVQNDFFQVTADSC